MIERLMNAKLVIRIVMTLSFSRIVTARKNTGFTIINDIISSSISIIVIFEMKFRHDNLLETMYNDSQF